MTTQRHGVTAAFAAAGMSLALSSGVIMVAHGASAAPSQHTPRSGLSDRLGELALPARTTGTARLKAADTDADLPALLKEATGAAVELKKNDETFEKLGPRVESLRQRLDSHNREGCTYPEDKPEVCRWYTERAARLNQERGELIAEIEAAEQQRRLVIARLQMLRAQLRVQAILNTGCQCDQGTPEEQKACWDRCFDGSDPRLRSCLHIANLEAFAACLRGGA